MSDTTGPTDVEWSTPPPPDQSAPPRPRVQVPALGPVALGWVILAAIFGNLALRTGVGSLSGTIAAIMVVGPILGSRLRGSALPRLFLALATVFALWLPIRASIWLTCLNFGAVAACLAAAAITHRRAEWRWNTAALGLAIVRAAMGFLFGSVVARSLARFRGARLARFGPIARGIAIAALPILVLGALLASADQVFAQSIAIDFDPSSGLEHLILVGLVAAAITGLVAMTAVPVNETFAPRRPLGTIETIILLGAVAALYSAFAFVQLISALGGADQLLQEQGLTYAEYARSGFFQLLWSLRSPRFCWEPCVCSRPQLARYSIALFGSSGQR